jgi:hypothetical protein
VGIVGIFGGLITANRPSWKVNCSKPYNLDLNVAEWAARLGFVDILETREIYLAMKNAQFCLLLLALGSVSLACAESGVTIPAELEAFIEPQTILLAHAAADLNGDGLSDYVFILEKQKNQPSDPDIEQGQRPLKIALRGSDHALRVVKTNDKIVYCSSCGGVFGDPFDGLTARTKSFTVSHYGGSNWRWAKTAKFNYSRIDDTWQLVRVEEHSYHTSDPENIESARYTPPKDFGKIDIVDFDPYNFKGVGEK